jgi:hypothetical protein
MAPCPYPVLTITRPTLTFVSHIATMAPCVYPYSTVLTLTRPTLAFVSQIAAMAPSSTILAISRPTLAFVSKIAAMAPRLYHYSSNHYSSNPSFCVSDCGDGVVPVSLYITVLQ